MRLLPALPLPQAVVSRIHTSFPVLENWLHWVAPCTHDQPGSIHSLSACRFLYQLICSMSEISVPTQHCTFSNLYFPSLPGVSKSTSKSIFLTDREGKRLSITTLCNLHFLDWHLWPCQCLSSYVTNLNFVTNLYELSSVDHAQLWFPLDHLVSLIPVPSFLWSFIFKYWDD